MTPLLLEANESKAVVWKCDKPNSPRYCKILEFAYKKETTTYIRSRLHFYEEQILTVRDFVCDETVVSFKFHITMIDGKVANALNRTCS